MDTRIYVVFKTHFDIGFTDLSEDVISKYSKQMLSDVIKTCEETKVLGKGRQYVWTMSSWPLVKSIESGLASTENIAKAITLIKNGQISWHALPFTTHTEFCGLEEYIRGLEVSTNLSHEYGYWPLSAKMTDVPGHTWILPTILAGAGIKFLHLGCNPGCISPDVPRLFWWEGPDGSRILTFYSKGAYGSDCIPPADWQYPAWLALQQTNDNIGPQDSKIIQQIESTVFDKCPNAVVKIGTMDDFYNDIIQCNLDIPVIKKDLADTWIHGVGSYPSEVSNLRRGRDRLLNAEKLLTYQSILGIHSITENDVCRIHKAFENSLLFGEHTWGLDVKTHMGAFRHYNRKDFEENKNSEIYRHMEQSWDEQRQRVKITSEISNELLSESGDSLARNVRIDGHRIVVFNSNGIKGDAWVDIENSIENNLIDSRNNDLLITRNSKTGKQVFIKNLPSFGYVTLIPEQNKNVTLLTEQNKKFAQNDIRNAENNQNVSIENSYYSITADKFKGTIVSFYDKKSQKEWVDTENIEGFAGYRYDTYGIEDVTSFIRDYTFRFYDWLMNDLGRINYPQCPHRVLLPRFNSIEVVKDKDRVSLIITAHGSKIGTQDFGDCDTVVTTATLLSQDKEVKFKFELLGKHETSIIEGGHFVFPLKIDRPQYRINKLGSIVDPTVDIAKDANNILYCLENFVDINDGNHGLCILSKDTPLFSIGDEGLYKYRKGYKESKPWLYFNAFNNTWGTNFPQWMGGDYTYEFSLFTHENDWQTSNISENVAKITSPAVAYSYCGDEGTLPLWGDLVDIPKNLSILAFKKASFLDDSYILRLREMNGQSCEIKISLPTATSVLSCDLQERISGDVVFQNGEICLYTKPFGLYSYIVKFKKSV